MTERPRIRLPSGGWFYPSNRGRLRPVVSVRQALQGVLEDLDFERGNWLGELGERWDDAVGVSVARHSYPWALHGQQLEVRVESSAWCQQLQYRKRELLDGIRRVLGECGPEDLRFTVGELPHLRRRSQLTH